MGRLGDLFRPQNYEDYVAELDGLGPDLGVEPRRQPTVQIDPKIAEALALGGAEKLTELTRPYRPKGVE